MDFKYKSGAGISAVLYYQSELIVFPFTSAARQTRDVPGSRFAGDNPVRSPPRISLRPWDWAETRVGTQKTTRSLLEATLGVQGLR